MADQVTSWELWERQMSADDLPEDPAEYVDEAAPDDPTDESWP